MSHALASSLLLIASPLSVTRVPSPHTSKVTQNARMSMSAASRLPPGAGGFDDYDPLTRRLPISASWPQPLNTKLDAGSIEDSDHTPESAVTTATSATFPTQSETSVHSSGSAEDIELPQGVPTLEPHRSPKRRKKAKDKMPLAADQPLTSQGKERVRVYLACAQCRQRKIRCDGAKPCCEVCTKRGITACRYDSAPKRRGPDRVPGSRSRAHDEEDELDGVGPSRRRRRRATSGAPPGSVAPSPDIKRSADATTHDRSRRHGDTIHSGTSDMPPSPVEFNNCKDSPLSDQYQPLQQPQTILRGAQSSSSAVVNGVDHRPFDYPPRSAYISEVVDEAQAARWAYALAPEPSLEFVRATWWDSLLNVYCASGGAGDGFLSISPHARELATRAVTQDVRWLFKKSNYWLAFFHPQSFLDRMFDPARRRRMQPALVLSVLAFSTLLQSSDLGRGAPGRVAALRLVDEAQTFMQTSINARWIDDDLAQAALLLAMFEVCGHPNGSHQRARDAMVMLDSIIRVLSFTSLDASDPAVTTYATPGPLPPGTGGPLSQAELQRVCYGAQKEHAPSAYVSSRHHSREPCSCESRSLGAQSHLAREQTPLWLATAGWSNDWSEAEVRKESCRRLCWSALSLAAGHTSYASAITGDGLDLAITNPANFALFFNGEATCRAVGERKAGESKETVWALYNRLMLLWHSCLRTRVDNTLSYPDKAQFAMAAWLELDAIEEALDSHTCELERAFMFQGREVIFNTRMVISYEYQKFIPDVMTNFNGFFHRAKAEEWLKRQLAMATVAMQGLWQVTGLPSNLLVFRPFLSFWFMAQISRCLMLWRVDTTLQLALEVAEKWLPPVEYLLAIWPSPATRVPYDALRRQLSEACVIAGRQPLPPVKLLLPSATDAVI